MLTCSNPTCLKPFDQLHSTRHNQTPDAGALLLCGHCGHVSVVEQQGIFTDHTKSPPESSPCFSTRLLTSDEHSSFHPDTVADLNFAIRAVIAQHSKNNRIIITPPWYKG